MERLVEDRQYRRGGMQEGRGDVFEDGGADVRGQIGETAFGEDEGGCSGVEVGYYTCVWRFRRQRSQVDRMDEVRRRGQRGFVLGDAQSWTPCFLGVLEHRLHERRTLDRTNLLRRRLGKIELMIPERMREPGLSLQQSEEARVRTRAEGNNLSGLSAVHREELRDEDIEGSGADIGAYSSRAEDCRSLSWSSSFD